MAYTLHIKLDEKLSKDIKDYYKNLESIKHEDSGIDLVVPNEMNFQILKTKKINHKVQCAMYNNKTGELSAYYLYPRSSLSKHPLILANHVGIIDKGYRGDILAKVYCVQNKDHPETLNLNAGYYHIPDKSRLFQITSPDLSPLSVKIVEELPESKRGTGGYGSTGLTI